MVEKNEKIADLLTTYPFLKEKLIERNSVFKRLNNKAIFNSVGKFARIEDVAKVSRENLQELLAFINNEIDVSGK
jgi:uncharacterized membrane-anchored protein YjiN (DUF445 family)